MFCTRCGQPVTQGSAFCSHCGFALASPAELQPPVMEDPGWQRSDYPEDVNLPPQGYYVPTQHSYGQPRGRKNKTGLVVGLTAGAAVILAVIAMLLLVWPGFLNSVSVAGVWYSESRGEAIVFGAGRSFDAYTYYGDFDGDYEYDKASGKGHIEMSDGRKFDFIADNGKLKVSGMGVFVRADERFDIDAFIGAASEKFAADSGGS